MVKIKCSSMRMRMEHVEGKGTKSNKRENGDVDDGDDGGDDDYESGDWDG